MQKQKKSGIWRVIALAALYAFAALIFIGRLIYLQVSGQDYYSMSTPARFYTRTVTVQAQRGEIFDRNGKPLVVNEYSYNISADYSSKPSSNPEFNRMLLDIIAAAERSGDTLSEHKQTLDITVTDSGLKFAYPEGFEESVRGGRYRKLVTELHVKEDAGIEAEARALMLHFGIMSSEKNSENKTETYYNYTYPLAAELFAIRLDMELSGFSPSQPYMLAENVSIETITSVEEK